MSSLETNLKPSLRLVLGDGAIRAGFVAGALGRLVEKAPDLLSKLSLIYGSSASSGNAMYLTNFGISHPGEVMWTELLADNEFIVKRSIFSSLPVYNIKYLVEQIFRLNTPLRLAESAQHPDIGIVFPAVEVGKSEVVYFANASARSQLVGADSGTIEPMEEHDIYHLIGAASAAPFVYDRPFDIKGRLMIDAAALAPSLDDLHFKRGDYRTIYIFCRQPPTLLKRIKYWSTTLLFLLLVRPFRRPRLPIVSYIQYATKPRRVLRSFKAAFEQEAIGEAVVIMPRQSLGDIDDNTAENLKRNYLLGEKAADEALGRVNALISSCSQGRKVETLAS